MKLKFSKKYYEFIFQEKGKIFFEKNLTNKSENGPKIFQNEHFGNSSS